MAILLNLEPIQSLHNIPIKRLFTWEAYFHFIHKLVGQNTKTGQHQDPALAEYTRLNLQRMERIYKSAIIDSDILQILKLTQAKMHWIAISEPWCGDAAQNLPVIAKISKVSGIPFFIMLRDENPEIMDLYLSNGTRSIPKLIGLNTMNYLEMFTWGPRPESLHKIILIAKQNNIPHDVYVHDAQIWYNQDRTVSLQKELLAIFRGLSA